MLFGGFRQVSGPGPPAFGPVLHLGQPASVVSYGGTQLYPRESFVQLHLVLWWTRRRWTAGEERKLYHTGLFSPHYYLVDG